MPRFSSQRTRQALLILGNPLNPDGLSESIELFDQDGNPVDLNAPPEGLIPAGGETGQYLVKDSDTDFAVVWATLPEPPPPSGPAPGTMVWKGVWDQSVDYVANDVVLYDDGDGTNTYIFTEDVAGTPPGDDPVPDFDGHAITTFFDPAASSFEVTVDDTSLRTGILKEADQPYVAIAFKAVTSGQIEIRTAPVDGVSRDMFANFYSKKFDNTWQYRTQNDESSGLGHPRILGSYGAPNIFLLAFCTFGGGASGADTQYGDSRIFLGPNNAATFEAFNFAAPVAFPVESVALIG